MKLTFKHNRTSVAVVLAISLSACVRFDTRMQANGEFDYQDAILIAPYEHGEFSNEEARDNFVIPVLTEQQKSAGYKTNDVDVRPPTQFMSVIDGVLLEKTADGNTKIWFNAFNQKEDMQDKVWKLIESYLAKNDIKIASVSSQEIVTDVFYDNKVFGSYFNKNHLFRESTYRLTIEKQKNGHSVALTVDALSYKEINEDKLLKFDLTASRKHKIETRFVNDLLKYAYKLKESEQLESADKQSLAIKLGFDDNHQNTWIVESEFMDTWRKLPGLFRLLNFKIIEDDKNLGYFLLKYSEPSQEYWIENNIKPFELAEDEYFIQLGEVTGGTTSILWLDENKKPLSDQKITEIYLSITDHVRGALIENEKQTKEF